jgi:hypothetical protein
MIKKHSIFCLTFGILFSLLASATEKTDTLSYSLNMRTSLGFGDYSPFLSSGNEYDRYSISPNNISFWGTMHKLIDHTKNFDYGFGTELDANISKAENRFFPGELYAEGKVWCMVISAGMKRETYGNSDPLLSSGGMLWSRNSRPMPCLTLKTDGYIKVPFTFGLVELKGGLVHGWFTDSTVTKNTLLHYKYLGGRVGGNLPVRITYSLHHVAQWAGTSPVYGYSPATFKNFIRVFAASSGDENSPATERLNTLGNHILSSDWGLELSLRDAELDFYWQNISEDRPVPIFKHNAFNGEDGLWGVSVRLPKFEPLSRFVLEYMSTTDMSGPWHDLDGVIYGGQDDYYNNSVYPNGWSFNGMTIGNPWLTSPKYNEGGAIGIKNNRVRLYYAAGIGKIDNISYKATIAFSQNYGSSWTVPESKNQFSWQVEANTPAPFWKNTVISAGLSNDIGKMYGNNFAFLLGISWNGLITY